MSTTTAPSHPRPPLLHLGAAVALAAAGACSGSPEVNVTPPVPAVTALTPPPGPFNGERTVTLTTDRPATIFVTTDGSDPRVESAARRTGDSALEIALTATTTLTFFSRTPEGADEAIRSAEYVRAGGPPGTAAGVVVVGTIALGHPVALRVREQLIELGTLTAPGELPFSVTGLASGTHRLTAWADLNGDGAFEGLLPMVDLASAPTEIELDLGDPFRASAEGLRIYLGAPQPERCGLQGQLTLPKPEAGDVVEIRAVKQSDLAGGALGSLIEGGGFAITAEPPATQYPWVIMDLEPSTYVPLANLSAPGTTEPVLPAFTVVFNPFAGVPCAAGQVTQTSLAFGGLSITGTITLQATAPPPLVYGVVAARSVALTRVQAVLTTVAFTPQQDGTLVAPYVSRALHGNSSFSVRVFTNVESASPLGEAAQWLLDITGGTPGDATVLLLNEDVRQDLALTRP